MASFRYLALDQQGRQLAGELDAESARAARARLRERGLLPLKIEGDTAAMAVHGSRRRTLSRAALVLLTQQLSTLLNAGLPLERALAAVMEQCEQMTSRRVLDEVRSVILQGCSLSGALAQQPGVFPPLYRALVDAGEQSGHLGAVMQRLADYLQRRARLQQKILQALAYPLSVLVVAMLVVAGLMSYVVPQVVGVFVQTRQALPWLTRALMACSQGLRTWGAAGLVSMLLLSLLLAAGWRRAALRCVAERALLKLPVVGRLLLALNTARLASTLAILVAGGVPLLSSLATVRPLLSLQVLQQALSLAAERVREGQSLAVALGQAGLFPPVLVYLIRSGEASGTLATMLERAAEQQEQEVERRLATFTALMEPLLILFMGVVVMVIVLAVMLPIIEMNQMVH
jgi:general secretion pathway protein F